MITLRSSISPTLKGETLRQGAIFSAMGSALLLCAAFLPLSVLATYGFALFMVSCILIAQGLVPYRRLLLEEMRPNELHFDGEELFFLQNSKPLFRLHKSHIEEIRFKDDKKNYGIILRVKKPLHKQIIVLTSRGRFMRYLARCKKRLPNDSALYLPFFSQYSYKELLLALRECADSSPASH